MPFVSLCSAIFQPENRNWEDPGWEGPVTGWTAEQPHWTGRPAGGTVSCAEHQQSPHQWQSKSRFFDFFLNLTNVSQEWREGKYLNWSLWMSGGPASTVPGAAQPSDQPALPGRHQSDGTEGLRSALPGTAGSWQDQNDSRPPSSWTTYLTPLQVKLELIRQAESFEQVKDILEERVGEAGSSSADHVWASEVRRNQIEHLQMGPNNSK